MVTAMEDACPNGVREEEEEAEMTAPGPPGVDGPPAVQCPQEPGGEERRRKDYGGCFIFRATEKFSGACYCRLPRER